MEGISMNNPYRIHRWLLILGFMVLGLSSAKAQNEDSVQAQNENVMLEEVLVTATKKAGAQEIQNVPVAITAFSGEMLDIMHVNDIQGLSFTMPNVGLDSVGTGVGVANFTIRGQGINSSVPSVEPAVGVFVDGVYMGTTYGIIFDTFDLESVEVLRGPQGVLFGRNVSAGAVLINTSKPTETFEARARVAVETGLNKTASATLSGPLVQDTLLGKLSVYANRDDGWFTNQLDGGGFGASDTTLVRGALTYLLPSDSGSITARYEHGESDGDGAVTQNHGLYPRDSHKIAVNRDFSSYDAKWDFASAELSVGIGNGVLTDILGWRELEQFNKTDVDGLATVAYHVPFSFNSDQFSNELRYNIAPSELIDLTAGVYYFDQNVDYVEHRILFGGASITNGGAELDQKNWAVFLSIDWHVTDTVTILSGIRYTKEKKAVNVANINATRPCDWATITCSAFDFVDDHAWSDTSPKLGVQWRPNDDTQWYATYSQGYRSGGYNFRNTSPTAAPGPYDPEDQDTYEIGFKLDTLDQRVRLNAAIFHNKINNVQREVIAPDLTTGTTVIMKNTGAAKVNGLELELTAALTQDLVLRANYGYLDGEYSELFEDINRDGAIDELDYGLGLPRLAKNSYGADLTWQGDVSASHQLIARLAYNHRDRAPLTDDNVGYLDAVDLINASLSMSFLDNTLTVGLYGHNLTNDVVFDGDFPLPGIALFGGPGASFSPIQKGRVYGAEVIYNF